jgi:FKBP12-rapamycin complex-associated protein
MGQIFELVSDNLKRHISLDVLGCFVNFVEALGEHAAPYVMDVIEKLFESTLSDDLIKCLHSIRRSVPSKQLLIERRLFQEISFCLAGKAVDLFSTKNNNRPTLLDPGLPPPTSSSLVNQPTLEKNFTSTMSLSSLTPVLRPKKAPLLELDEQEGRTEMVVTDPKSNYNIVRTVINKSMKLEVVDKFVLSLRTLRTIGESCMQVPSSDGDMMLPFLRNVISMYFDHPANSVRQEAVICCLLLLPYGDAGNEKREQSLPQFKLGGVSGSHFEEVLHKLLRMAVSDLSPIVRLCIVRGLDERYDAYLSLNLLAPLFLILEDEALAVRACALQILGRLSRMNPAPILPSLRRVLMDLIVELRCGGDDGGRKEVAIRLMIVFLREEALQRLTRPFISSIIDVLPLIDVAPRLATASLEALGDIATLCHSSINPWLRQLITHILENIQDQNSSKQRVSLWALGKIVFGAKYVVAPYIDYPQLLSQASDILPTTKRAPWELRREVFRVFGILGAMSPDRFGSGSTTRKGGGKGGGYFVDLEDEQGPRTSSRFPTTSAHVSGKRIAPEWKDQSTLLSSSLHNRISSAQLEYSITSSGNHTTLTQESAEPKRISKDSGDDEPAHLFMYEQYAMTAQPLSKLSPARRLSPSDEGFYPAVAVQALMRILKDSSLSNFHGMVMKVCTD